MVKTIKSEDQLRPMLPSRRVSDFEWDVAKHPFQFPQHYRLVITTTRGVYLWDINGINQIFRSGSEGIVAAKKLEHGTDMLAVADSQFVVLHEINGNTQKSYRLKGSQVRGPSQARPTIC